MLRDQLTTTFPNSIPLNHELKWVFNDRWFRIHSLPESKRYADSQNERKMLLARQYDVIDNILGGPEEVLALVQFYSTDELDQERLYIQNISNFNLVWEINLKLIYKEEYEDCDNIYLEIYSKPWSDVTNKNKLLLAVANDRLEMLLVNFAKKRIVAPYDGGVDVILDTQREVGIHKRLYSDWLSSHPQGL